jgi:hypothetical protein
MSTTFTKSELIKYTYVVTQYELAKYRHDREVDSRIKNILEEDLQRAYERLIAVREALGL